MAEQIGLARNFTLEWLDSAANCQLAGKNKAEAREYLDGIIGEKLHSKDNIRKTRTMMLNLWYDNEPWIQNVAIAAYRDATHNEHLPLHWAMLLVYYPIFFDLSTVIGSLLEYREVITLQQIRSRIYEKWGARTTLEHSLSKNMQSLKDVGVLIPQQTVGTYTATIPPTPVATAQSAIPSSMPWLRSPELRRCCRPLPSTTICLRSVDL